MAITAANLRTPPDGGGALTLELLTGLQPKALPADTAAAYAAIGEAKVAAWAGRAIGAATELVARADRGAIAWAHYRALMDRAQQIQTLAMSAGAEGASESFSTSQAVELKKDAASYLGTFEVEEADEGAAARVFVAPRASRSVPLTVRW